MASLTTALKLMNLAYGESGAYGYTNWGDLTDANHDIIENALTGQSSITVNTTDVTLTDTQHVSLHLNLSGTLTGNRSIILKASQPGMWLVSNGTSGAYTVTVKPSGGSGVVVDQGKKAILYSNGTNAIAIYDAGDFYTAAEVDTLVTAESVEISEDFVATGAFSAGGFVALRSDGTVEAVTGTETVASIGSDTTVTAVTSMRWAHAAYNATSGKLVAVFYDLGASNTFYAVIGTLSGSTITWGTAQTFTGGTGATYWTRGQVAWNAAGDKIIIAFQGATGYQSFVCASVSGTTMTFGSVVQNGTVNYPTSNDRLYLVHDNTHGSRFFIYSESPTNIVAGTYSGTTITLGTSATFSITGVGTKACVHYDAPNARLVVTTGGATSYVKCATVSGTTWTVGAEASTTTAQGAISTMEVSSGKVVLLGVVTTNTYSLPKVQVATFSGTTTTINTAVTPFNYSIEGAVLTPKHAVYEATSGKCVFAVRLNDQDASLVENQGDLSLIVGTVSGTTITFTAPTTVRSDNVAVDKIFARGTNSEIAAVYSNQSDFGRWSATTGSVSSGSFVTNDTTLLRSVPATNPIPTTAGIAVDYALDFLCGWTLVNFNRFGTTGTATSFMSYAVVLPTESTNANNWVGVSRDTVTNGQTATIRMRGGKATGLSGLTPNTDYYLKGDGTLISTDNGRYAGRALSSTKMLLETL